MKFVIFLEFDVLHSWELRKSLTLLLGSLNSNGLITAITAGSRTRNVKKEKEILNSRN